MDGAMNASEKSKKLNWLRKEPPENTCHFLTNVRCLSEVMDIPALDAVLFLAPRKSTSEIVQSVSIVMRKSPGKDFGYIVVPVVIPEEIELEKAIDHNRTYPVVWQVLQALRSHDDKFSILINKLKHNFDTAGKIDLITVLDESRKSSRTILNKSNPLLIDKEIPNDNSKIGPDFVEPIEEVYNKAVLTRLVKRVGNPDNLIKWTDDVINIADTYIEKIKVILAEPKHQKEIAFFKNFSSQVREDLNVTVTDLEVVEMMAQHMITAPVFEAIYQNIPFVRQNVLSFSMHKLLEAFQNHHFEKETNKLKGFYDSVKQEVETLQERLSWIDKNTWKQNLMIELYEDFFSQAFPKMHERLDIVYTPVEIVDFILKSVNELLENEFGKNLGSNDLHIIDPFTGTGTFISRLLQSGLINEKDLPYKYQNEIHANEIGLLAYYIASINIASVYQDKTGGDYEQFTGICLTDTFQQYEKDNLISKYLLKNSMRRKNQKELPFSVIIGNPLYSIRQKSQSESNKNIDYPILDERIKASYTNNPTAAQLLKGSDDNYIRAFRWASDRLKGNRDGIIGFVTNSNFLEKSAMEGLRKHFAKEFLKIYIVNLRGDIKKNIDSGKSFEGENVFGDKSITGIAMIFLVKKANENNLAKIYYHDIGISLNRTRKLKIINSFGSISGIEKSAKFHEIYPNVQGDWITQISEGFTSHILIASKKSQTNVNIFDNYSSGISTYRDPWCYNFSHNSLVKNIKKTIEFYNSERIRYHEKFDNIKSQKNISQINKFVKNDASQISWSRKLHRYLLENRVLTFEEDSIVKSLYRPFTKSWLYFKRELVEELSLIRLLFPKQGVDNLVICVTGVGSKSNFSVMLANEIPCYDLLEKTQCFPMYLYNRTDTNSEGEGEGEGLLQENDPNQIFQKSETITQVGLKHFQDAFPTLNIQREDLFYYIYGILHSSDYRASYKDNLTKELPRIPRVSNPNDFLAFSNAGKELGKLHIDYDNVSKYPLEIETSDTLSDNDYSVTKMKYGKIKNENDLSTIIYNSKITLKGIPLRAYDYILYGKSAIDWIVKSQGLTTDTKSGIVHDSNIWAIETMENPKYPLELLQRVITVSLETLRIIENLPKLELL
ncbi:MAG: hypothetical protein LBF22_06085 [Deltaproteobacteria bacterium]|nr:hypothetical protein [Deltaproteobacteria bacterium]